MRIGYKILVSVFFLVIGIRCEASSPMQVPPSSPLASLYEVPAQPKGQTPGPGAEESRSARASGIAGGSTECFGSSECVSGVCEGQGCDAGTPGHCVAPGRRCTTDETEFCGCDGKRFLASSTCPGARYLARGECPAL